jgi:hypothetical protein
MRGERLRDLGSQYTLGVIAGELAIAALYRLQIASARGVQRDLQAGAVAAAALRE